MVDIFGWADKLGKEINQKVRHISKHMNCTYLVSELAVVLDYALEFALHAAHLVLLLQTALEGALAVLEEASFLFR